jgi:diguanylate cyclase (GGDEF)-like protein
MSLQPFTLKKPHNIIAYTQTKETQINQDCLLAKNQFKPYSRCEFCDLKTINCLGMQYNLLTAIISLLLFSFLFLQDPILIRINILTILGMLFWLGYKINTNTDELAYTNAQNSKLTETLQEYNTSLEEKVNLRTDELRYLASHDPLTGLYNRYEFEKQLNDKTISVQNSTRTHVLCYLDLDQFKIVNDSSGHAAGDQLLCNISKLILQLTKKEDILARIGGDEFALLLGDCSLESAVRVVERIRKKIEAYRFSWDDKIFTIGVTAGIVAITDDGATNQEVLSAADTACFIAKDSGRNQYHIYRTDDALSQKRHGEMQWVTRIVNAIEENRLVLYVQRINDVNENSEKYEHYEILVRMLDEEGEIVPPMAFIPAAERYGLMPQMDRWIVQHALEALETLMAIDDEYTYEFSINLSGASVGESKLIPFIEECFEVFEIGYKNVCFEITETAAISNMNAAIEFIETFKDLGCKFSLDDFGSGLSSFAYLKDMPVTYLKIDGCFIADIASNEVNYAMVDAINKVGNVMGIKTIGECVENKEILEILSEIGVNYGQGFGLEKPYPLSELLAKRS